jgi:hypothetical protein
MALAVTRLPRNLVAVTRASSAQRVDRKLAVVTVNRTQISGGAASLPSAPASAAWGNITGTLVNQLDLKAALDAKANAVGGSLGQNVSTITSGPPLSALKVVKRSGVYASTDTIGDRNAVLGVTKAAVGASTQVEVVTSGVIADALFTLTPNLPVFLGVNGDLTQTAPVFPAAPFRVQIGKALTATELLVEIGQPILLS